MLETISDDGEVELAGSQGNGGDWGANVVGTDHVCRLIPVVEDGNSELSGYISDSTYFISY